MSTTLRDHALTDPSTVTCAAPMCYSDRLDVRHDLEVSWILWKLVFPTSNALAAWTDLPSTADANFVANLGEALYPLSDLCAGVLARDQCASVWLALTTRVPKGPRSVCRMYRRIVMAMHRYADVATVKWDYWYTDLYDVFTRILLAITEDTTRDRVLDQISFYMHNYVNPQHVSEIVLAAVCDVVAHTAITCGATAATEIIIKSHVTCPCDHCMNQRISCIPKKG